MRGLLLFSLCLYTSIMAAHAQLIPPAGVDIDWYVGHESDDSFTITEPDELAGVSWLLRQASYPVEFLDKTIFLGGNIDMYDWLDDYGEDNWLIHGWDPIGIASDRPFNGSFIGNGYTISGLWMESSNLVNCGLFGFIGQAGSISNLIVEIAERGISGARCVGGLAGFSEGTIANCTVKSNSLGTSIVSGHFSAGGLVGFNMGIIRLSSSTVKVEGTTNSTGDGYDTGGLVGSNSGSIVNCYATGEVVGVGYVGGLVGFNETDIFASYSLGTVSGNAGVGGLVGGSPTGNIDDCFFTDSNSNNSLGTLKTTTEMKDPSTFINSGWDFNYAWGIDTNTQNPINDGYPYLNAPIEDLDTTWFDQNESVFTITTPEQLAGMAILCYRGESFEHKTVRLGNDIDIRAWLSKNRLHEGWVPIVGFLGTFDGNNKIISGLWINKPYKSLTGFFDYHDTDAVIKDLTIVLDNKDHHGIIGKSIVGGLVGLSNGNIYRCAMLMEDKTATAVSGVFQKIGGLVGDNTGLISECYTSVNVTGPSCVGGLVGGNYGIIRNCYTTGVVEEVDGIYLGSIGGLAGFNGIPDDEGSIINCYSVGEVIGTHEIGGGIGANGIESEVISSFFNVSANTLLNGIERNNGIGDVLAKSTSELKESGTFTDWDFDDVWALDNSAYQTINHGYPYLQWVEMKHIDLTFGDNFSYEVNGATVTSDSHVLPVDPYCDFAFTITPTTGYTVANAVLKANNQVLSAENNEYILNPVFCDSTITVSGVTRTLHHLINLTAEEGIVLNPSPGAHAVESGSSFTFYITLEEGYEGRTPQVTVDGKSVDIQLRPNGVEWVYVITSISSNVNVSVSLAVTDNEQFTATRYYTRDGQLFVEAVTPAQLTVYTLTGNTIVNRRIPVGLSTIPLPAGIYIIKVDKTIARIVVGK